MPRASIPNPVMPKIAAKNLPRFMAQLLNTKEA
jgi:hypothetical protein